MPQEKTEQVLSTLPEASKSEGKIRPFETTLIEWVKHVNPDKVGKTAKVHPSLAEKLIKAGKAKTPNKSK